MNLQDAFIDAQNAGYSLVSNNYVGFREDIEEAIKNAAGISGEYVRINNLIFNLSDAWKDDAEVWELEH